ncbi:uncharacterized protein EI97DRAFT_431092 [Westerdykella ornata]|uniref:Homeobox domain-containing protein n=1 Tax=Westerdykella ornata TaxID=318751 RepID=A0A6A6JQD4_WESOR|nr:uncharacterized protein EI97DRAFT_431092 [Westerdykella ornata]KAF2278841.1 hypothetical protein EI97DRAFT_431092 [Westerdykella ornata]
MPASSSPPASSPSSSTGATSLTKTSPHAALAFLVHSPTTVANDLPPDVDNRPLARQKRRRTSKEDEEILKAEYLKNPKPDKAARLQIVAKVALGEKEVQIWFQNKRQNDRRRSRSLGSSSSAIMSDSPTMSNPPSEDGSSPSGKDASEEPKVPTHKEEMVIYEDTKEEAELILKRVSQDSTTTKEPDNATTTIVESQSTVASQAIPVSDSLISVSAPTVETAPTEPSASQNACESSQGPSQSRNSWISNRRSASFRYTEEYAAENATFPVPTPTTEDSSSSRPLKRAHSFVRLSMADDGTARVITDADKTPSPPHPKSNPLAYSRAAAGLRRSYSAAGLNERLAAASRGEPSPKIPRMASSIGRSRDSRAWEFWCDPDTRNNSDLTTRAQQEGSGSAADAIGLLRASRRVLGNNQLRQNSPMLSRSGSAKANGNTTKRARPPMQRASTSFGRLQTKNAKGGKGDDAEVLRPSGDSDKENWDPDEHLPSSQRPQHPQPRPSSQRARRPLGENMGLMSQSSSLGSMLARERQQQQQRKNGVLTPGHSDPEQDDEVRNFMNSGNLSAATNLSTAEEAGCVEGLLKLSQGNWR